MVISGQFFFFFCLVCRFLKKKKKEAYTHSYTYTADETLLIKGHELITSVWPDPKLENRPRGMHYAVHIMLHMYTNAS